MATSSEAGRALARQSWDGKTPAQRRDRTLPGRTAAAVETLVRLAPALTPEQAERIRALLPTVQNDGGAE